VSDIGAPSFAAEDEEKWKDKFKIAIAERQKHKTFLGNKFGT
jgi:hypothetical protein